ncbi:MAG TPA: MBL fold metallo-hydrolase [Candidatus Saccharimonadia bacterium]|nr:MBL fold metallo-hydrolase [Candidatus Saccharimonadia bacterium]
MALQINYLGQSCFSLKGKEGIVITDPFDSKIGLNMPKVSADLVTVSHQHPDHNAISRVAPTVRRDKPFIVDAPGEYEVAGISVFGYPTFHDDKKGAERGPNIMYAIHLDGLVVVHLGDLGHALDDKTLEKLEKVDVLLVPVGGKFTIDAKTAVEVIRDIEPSYVIPMHYKTEQHQDPMFADMGTVEDFMKAYGVTKEAVGSFSISAASLPEETELVVMKSV